MEARVAQVRAEHGGASARLQDKRERLRECDAAGQRLRSEQGALQAQLSDCSVDRNKLEAKHVPPCPDGRMRLALPGRELQGVMHPAHKRGPPCGQPAAATSRSNGACCTREM